MSSELIEYLTVAKEITPGVAALVGAGVAVLGLRTWWRQLRGKTEYELARRLLRAVYRVRDEVDNVRNPLIMGAEFRTAAEEQDIDMKEDKPGFSNEVEAAVYQRRWDRLSEALSDLQVETTEAEVIWGDNVYEHLEPLEECISKLRVSIWRYLRAKSGSQWVNQPDSNTLNEIHDVIYKVSEDPEEDEFTGRVKKAVEEAELHIRPHLSQ